MFGDHLRPCVIFGEEMKRNEMKGLVNVWVLTSKDRVKPCETRCNVVFLEKNKYINIGQNAKLQL